jgi:hypothetical protein
MTKQKQFLQIPDDFGFLLGYSTPQGLCKEVPEEEMGPIN